MEYNLYNRLCGDLKLSIKVIYFFVVYREQPHFQTHHDSSCFVGCHTHLIFACNKLAPQRAVANNEDSHIHNLSLVISQCLTALICIDLHCCCCFK